MRPHRSGGTIKGTGKFKTTRQYTGPDGLPVAKQFVQRKGETQRDVIRRADLWQSTSIGSLPSPKMSLETAWKLFVEHRKRHGRAPKTIKDIEFVGSLINARYGATQINALTAPMVDLLTSEWLEKPRTALKIREQGRAAYNWFIKMQWVKANPFKESDPVAYEPDNWGEPMPAAAFEAALAKIDKPALRALFLLLRWQGCRPATARGLLRSDLWQDDEGRLFMRRKTKTKSSDKPQFIPEPAASAILELPKTSLWVFSLKNGRPIAESTVCHVWKEACEAADVPHRSPYALRDMRLTELAHHLNKKELAYVAGHAQVGTTWKYYIGVEQEALIKKIGG